MQSVSMLYNYNGQKDTNKLGPSQNRKETNLSVLLTGLVDGTERKCACTC